MSRIVCLLCMISLALSLTFGEEVIKAWGGERGWQGWTKVGNAWGEVNWQRLADPYPSLPHPESLAGGEGAKGVFRSPNFVIEGDIIRFWANGWDGRGGERGLNGFFLRSAKDNSLLRFSPPPLQDAFAPLSWLVSDLKGQEVYFEAVDGDEGNAFAWLGLALVEEVRKDVAGEKSALYAISFPPGLGTFKILTYDGAHRPTPPYLSSLGNGEQGTGRIRSPRFKINFPEIRLLVRGWDGQFGGAGRNAFQLVDAQTGRVLRSSPPPLSDFPQELVWDVGDLQGREVFIRVIDSDPASAFAWLGLDEVDAGPTFHIRFSQHPTLRGWQGEEPDRRFLEKGGIPFLAYFSSPLPENDSLRLVLGARARRLFLLGMFPSPDQGCPVWGDPNDSSSRFFLGDQFGTITIRYADGVSEEYPLILGESLFWGRLLYQYPDPFLSDEGARKTLKEVLRLYPTPPSEDGLYLAVINPRLFPIYSLEIKDSPQKRGIPVILGITVESVGRESIKGAVPLPHDEFSPDLRSFLAQKPLRSKQGKGGREDWRNLVPFLYMSEERLPSHLPLDIPTGYRGPRVKFEGNIYADILTNVFHHTLQDMVNKIDEEGMYHTSTKDAPAWGYESCGTFRRNVGVYYAHSWSRDLGRSLQELVALGYIDLGKRCADYCFKMARLWEERSQELRWRGNPLPPHWCRIINIPDINVGGGCFENDGHGLISLFIYKLWQRLPDKREWLSSHWEDVRRAGDWIVWQLEHPEISGAKDVLWTDSECAGGVGYTVYADYICMEALHALAEMADSIGEREAAQRWREYAERLKKGIERNYIVVEPKYGKAWTLQHSGWPHHSTVLGPLIISADRRGFAPRQDEEEWRAINEATYQRLIDSYRPFGFYGTAMGYGQGFVTQSALLLDRMKDATKMLEWTAKAIYDPRCQPYIVPEGCEVSPDGKVWHRTGDLGNGVQEAEIIKVLRLVLGIDNPRPGVVSLYPRLPYGWKKMEVKDYPIWLEGGRASLSLSLQREGNALQLTFSCNDTLPPLGIRLGPFEELGKGFRVLVNGKETQGEAVKSGDSWWVKARVPGGKEGSVKVERKG